VATTCRVEKREGAFPLNFGEDPSFSIVFQGIESGVRGLDSLVGSAVVILLITKICCKVGWEYVCIGGGGGKHLWLTSLAIWGRLHVLPSLGKPVCVPAPLAIGVSPFGHRFQGQRNGGGGVK